MRYDINGVGIDRCKNVGLTSRLKGYVSFSPNQSKYLENAGWIGVTETGKITDDSGNFDVSIPLSMIFGFAEDYRKIIVNIKLILIRSRSDSNAVIQSSTQADAVNYENFKIQLTRVEWLMPYVMLSDKRKIQLSNFIQKDIPIAMSYRSWELYKYPVLPTTVKQIWTVKPLTN